MSNYCKCSSLYFGVVYLKPRRYNYTYNYRVLFLLYICMYVYMIVRCM